jgi:hypothetical protein
MEGVRVTSERRIPQRPAAWWIRTVGYWTFTGIIAYEMIAGSLWDLLRIEYVRTVFIHLGYPMYLLSILAIWKFPCAVTLLVPGFPRVKEWAYAGAFFNYSGAVASHAFVGDGPGKWAGPLVFGLFTVASWALRPPNRSTVAHGTTTRTAEWIIPILAITVMLGVALLTLPRGPDPF